MALGAPVEIWASGGVHAEDGSKINQPRVNY
jgi:hypothetical protein